MPWVFNLSRRCCRSSSRYGSFCAAVHPQRSLVFTPAYEVGSRLDLSFSFVPCTCFFHHTQGNRRGKTVGGEVVEILLFLNDGSAGRVVGAAAGLRSLPPAEYVGD